MEDSLTEITSESWFDRILGSLMGIIFGLILIAISIFLLYWNESRAVTTARALKEASSAVVNVEPETVNPANDKKFIHVSGEVNATQTVGDPIFTVSAPAIRLKRKVEMYQWKEVVQSETRKKLGGGTETAKTYNYEKAWSNSIIDSSKFKIAEEHYNPREMLARDDNFSAPLVTLGGFKLTSSLIAKMSGDEADQLTEDDLKKLPPALETKAKLDGSGFYFGSDPASPAIGDQRVTFKILRPGVFSVLARQTGNTFEPYPTKSGRSIERVETGSISADIMFQHAATENTLLAWGLRLVGFLLMAWGIGLILNPISVFADVIPLIGDILGMSVAFVALLLAAVFSTVTIAIAWIVVRPILGGVMLAVAVAWFVLGKRLVSRRAA